jgi:transposase
MQEPSSEVVYQDEVWWSRLAQPQLHSWATAQHPLQVEELSKDKHDPDALALGCYGALRESNSALLLRFVQPRPVGKATIAYLSWLAEQLGKQGVRRVVVVWDNASWHVSKEVRAWLRAHNRAALAKRRAGEVGVQLTPCWLPSKSPWLNPIEVRWAHGKRAVAEPRHKLTAAELQQRVHAYYKCEALETIDTNNLP